MGIMLEKSGWRRACWKPCTILFGKLKGAGYQRSDRRGVTGSFYRHRWRHGDHHGLISLPTMLKRGYSAELATGTIAASGTLGQIIPLGGAGAAGGVLNVSVGNLLRLLLLPGVLLVLVYVAYIIIIATLRKYSSAPGIPEENTGI